MADKAKLILALTIPYIFLCAGCYQISFYSTFNINIFSFLDVVDIPTSAILPIIYGAAASLLITVLTWIGTADALPHGGGNKGPKSPKKELFFLILKLAYIITILWATIFSINSSPRSPILIWLPYFCLPGAHLLITNFLITEGMMSSEKHRTLMVNLILIIPAVSISIGRSHAREILENRHYQYSTYILPNQELKYIGKGSDYFFFVSKDNSTKYIFHNSQIKTLTLLEYKEKS